jgi:hypothetical protein
MGFPAATFNALKKTEYFITNLQKYISTHWQLLVAEILHLMFLSTGAVTRSSYDIYSDGLT